MIKADNGKSEKNNLPKEIELFAGGRYIGHYQYGMFRNIFTSYEKCAVKAAEITDWDEIVLFAVIKFVSKSLTPVSADFMIERMTEERFYDYYSSLEDGCRCFFVRNRQEDRHE